MADSQRATSVGIRVIDVPDLGRDAVLVDAPSMTLLLMDDGLTRGQRIRIMARVMVAD